MAKGDRPAGGDRRDRPGSDRGGFRERTGERPGGGYRGDRDRGGYRGDQDRGGYRGDRDRGGYRGDRDRDRGRYRGDRDRGFQEDRGPAVRDDIRRAFQDDRGGRGYRPGGNDSDEDRFEAPALADEIDARELAHDVRAELRSLAPPVADSVARHLVAAGQLLDEDPEMALAHARAARRLAPRIAAVREALGLAAYRNGEWQTAIGELRTYHRLTGRQTHLAVLADCERALGRPERAIDMYRTADKAKLSPEEAVELLIVAAGARGDMGQRDAAVAMLQVRELTSTSREPWIARLRYAYAEALLAAGRREEAREWFARAADVDDELATDAAERLLDLDGVVLDDVNDEDLDDEDLDDDVDEEAEFVDVDEAELDDETDETDETDAADAADAAEALPVDADAPVGPDLEDEAPDRVDADLEDLEEEDLEEQDLEADDRDGADQRHGDDVDLDPEVQAKSADSAAEPAVPEARFDPGTGAERTDREQG